MRTFLLGLLLAASVPLARAAAPADDGVFHDPFANDEAASAEKPAAAPVSDPLERMNRAVYQFNDKLYSWVLKPVARGYSFVAPKPVRESVDRFFVNLKYPVRGVNNLLEGRFSGAGIETARFVINTTVGVGGFFDPARHWNLNARPADFDKTLALYRVPSGAYLDLPLLGPSSLRGGMGIVGDMALSPTFYISYFGPEWIGYAETGVNVLNTTSLHYTEYDSLKAGTLDPYVAMRSAYFESRRAALEK